MISVIIPVYNIARYIADCIESVIRQTYSELEIILVDDGSTDNSPQICDEYASRDSRIKVIHKTNGGLVSARKAGILASTGELIAYVDGDDWIEPTMYEKLNARMQIENVDIVVCSRYEDAVDKRKEVYQGCPRGKYTKEDLKKKIFPRMIVNENFFEWGISPSLWDKLFRRECILSYQLDVDNRISWGEDAACTFPCMLNANGIYILDECLYHYRQNLDSMSKSIPDVQEERRRYQVMYRYTLGKLEKDKNIYDLREQWTEYVLFLMVARADGLYQDYEKLDYLFPFKHVKKNEKIILYGAGTYGRRLYKYLQKTNFCQVVKWVDQNYIELRKEGLDVYNPDCIDQNEYEHIVVAITYAKAKQGAASALIKKYGHNRVEAIDVDLILSEESKRAFGLN